MQINNNLNENNEFINYVELANILHLKVCTLRKWMVEGKFKPGRDYIKLGTAKKSKVLFKKDIINRIDKIAKF
ncbi:hypothetical protein LF845_06080 [Deferribacterales bacterium Es71-Z0220]|uniref:hypothetical protein n=1 Tax=Deferrivibrio essentukiensis TaxID=2880922 RepID=UPI001F62033D|nr:hypothetical protein [Deferrivibrio essentukiensis]MCB4204525.1 hypothetical protein [Deferrivibrio essentukiensis]